MEDKDIKCKICCGDHVEILKKHISDFSIDLIITSPPYDDLRKYENYKFDFESLAHELFRVLDYGGVLVWIVKDMTVDGSETGTSFKQALYFKDKVGFNLYDTMILEKNGSAYPSQVRYSDVFEYMFVLSKGKPKTVNLIEDRKNKWHNTKSFGIRSGRKKDGSLNRRSNKKSKVSKEYGVRFNIWRYNTGYGYSAEEDIAYKHPAIFPEQLAKDHILSWSEYGDWVLDPMSGSGTVLKMAYLNSRHSIGIDCSKKYCEIQKRRMRKVMKESKR